MEILQTMVYPNSHCPDLFCIKLRRSQKSRLNYKSKNQRRSRKTRLIHIRFPTGWPRGQRVPNLDRWFIHFGPDTISMRREFLQEKMENTYKPHDSGIPLPKRRPDRKEIRSGKSGVQRPHRRFTWNLQDESRPCWWPFGHLVRLFGSDVL